MIHSTSAPARSPWALGTALFLLLAASCGSDETAAGAPPGESPPPGERPHDGGAPFPEGGGGPNENPPPSECRPDNWPTADTVGLPKGTTLTPLEESHTERDGQIFDGIEFRGRLYVEHKNVVVRRSRLIGDIYYAIYAKVDDAYLTIEDSDIHGGIAMPNYFVGRRNHLFAMSGKTKDDGYIFTASHVLLEDNLIDGLVGGPKAHVDGIQVMGGTDIVVRHNWVEAAAPKIPDGGNNAAIFFKPDQAPIGKITVECNMLMEKEGYYPLRFDGRVGPISSPVVVRRNRWQRGHMGGPVTADSAEIDNWEDNAYVDGEVIEKP